MAVSKEFLAEIIAEVKADQAEREQWRLEAKQEYDAKVAAGACPECLDEHSCPCCVCDTCGM